MTETASVIGTAVCGNYLSTNCTMRGAVPGTSINQLALTPGNSRDLTTYVVNRSFTFRTGIVPPCAWGPGGGCQYFS